MSDARVVLEYCQSRLNYDPTSGRFTWKTGWGGVKANDFAGHVNAWGYLRIPLQRRKYNAHRLAWLIVYGEWPKGQIDHINGNKLDNRIENLRDVTPSLNQLANNTPRSNNSSGYVGVSCARGGKFRAALKVNGVLRHIGTFASAEAASNAYQAAKESVFHGITKEQP